MSVAVFPFTGCGHYTAERFNWKKVLVTFLAKTDMSSPAFFSGSVYWGSRRVHKKLTLHKTDPEKKGEATCSLFLTFLVINKSWHKDVVIVKWERWTFIPLCNDGVASSVYCFNHSIQFVHGDWGRGYRGKLSPKRLLTRVSFQLFRQHLYTCV